MSRPRRSKRGGVSDFIRTKRGTRFLSSGRVTIRGGEGYLRPRSNGRSDFRYREIRTFWKSHFRCSYLVRGGSEKDKTSHGEKGPVGGFLVGGIFYETQPLQIEKNDGTPSEDPLLSPFHKSTREEKRSVLGSPTPRLGKRKEESDPANGEGRKRMTDPLLYKRKKTNISTPRDGILMTGELEST